MKFTPTLCSKNASIAGGYAGGPGVSLHRWADELFGAAVPGPWLCCYMIRRFGWPNVGSDDHKDLCSWCLTTPIKGLFLLITPYLGGSNLHFAVRFTKNVGRELCRDPGRDAFLRRKEAFLRKWWTTHGRKIYVLGSGKREGDEDELIHEYGEKDGVVWGLWRRKPTHNFGHALPKNADGMFFWWLGQFLTKHHPDVTLPKMTTREKARKTTVFQRRVRAAIQTTMRDLLRPVYVRDIGFTPFGDIERTPEAIQRYDRHAPVERWPGAGYSPEYWFLEATPKERRGAA